MTKDEQIENRLTHIYWSIYLYNTSLSELQTISDESYSREELKIINSHTFNFYRVTLQYCFIMEYCKLLENGSKKNEQNVSSLNRLNEILKEGSSNNFQKLYNENLHLIDEMKTSSFYKKIKTLRDKKFGHADNNEINKPFTIEGLRTKDIACGFEHLRMIKVIFNNFGSVYGREYDVAIPSRERRTRNFVSFHAKYQHYFMNNSTRAVKDLL